MPNRTEAAQRKLSHVPPGGYSHCACSRLHEKCVSLPGIAVDHIAKVPNFSSQPKV